MDYGNTHLLSLLHSCHISSAQRGLHFSELLALDASILTLVTRGNPMPCARGSAAQPCSACSQDQARHQLVLEFVGNRWASTSPNKHLAVLQRLCIPGQHVQFLLQVPTL